MKNTIEWLGHASFRIKSANKVVYIDPWKLKGGEKADLILITHDHFDHCVPEDVSKIMKKDTVIVTMKDCAPKLEGDIRIMKPGDKITVDEVEIQAWPAYNLNKPHHPKAKGYLGFVIELEGERIYHAGDTDKVPELNSVQTDIALLPVGGTYTMTAEEAAQLANIIRPKLAIPMHYNDIVGDIEDAKLFKQLCEVPVELYTVSE